MTNMGLRIGIVGLGSIGRRHARHLVELGCELVALRTFRGALADTPAELRLVHEVHDFEAFVRAAPDAALVANPTALHGSTLASLLPLKIPVFVEKPLVAHPAELPVLGEADRRRILVGFCLRFHPMVRAIRSFVAAGRLGRVHGARLTFGSFLPAWHPYADHRTEYMARRDLGGGVLRTASHEIDLLQHWLGPVQSVAANVGTYSDLGIEADDTAHLLCTTRSGAAAIVELDFCSPQYVRVGSLNGELGRIEYDFATCRAVFVPRGGAPREAVHEPNPDAKTTAAVEEMYRAQMQDFIEFVAGAPSANCGIGEALHVSRIIEAAEASRPVVVAHDP